MENQSNRLFTIENFAILGFVAVLAYLDSQGIKWPILVICAFAYLLCFYIFVTYWRFWLPRLIGYENIRVSTIQFVLSGDSNARQKLVKQITAVAESNGLKYEEQPGNILKIQNVDINVLNLLSEIDKPEDAYAEIEEVGSGYLLRKRK